MNTGIPQYVGLNAVQLILFVVVLYKMYGVLDGAMLVFVGRKVAAL